MNMEQFIQLLQSVSWKGSRLGLERVETLLAMLGEPEKKLRFIHVAGSNGKGSVASMLASILTAAGYRTGLYTSPHLVSYRERMRINGQDITEEELCALADEVRLCVEQMEDKPTEFELLTCMALLYFAQEKCDIVVLEVGLGGRLDATNAIPAPEAAVIMNIGLEHTDVLGGTLAEIAAEKAGIIKKGCPVVTYPGAPEVEAVFQKVCAQRHAAWHKACFQDLTVLEENLDGQSFCWREFSGLKIRLLGKHQLWNAAVVLETITLLQAQGWKITEQAVRNGLASAQWPARMEVLRRRPLFLLDGAHNPQCAQALAESLPMLLNGKKAIFLTGVLADKDYPGMIDQMLPLAQEFICLTPLSDRALPAENLAEYLRGQGARARACDDVQAGVQAALTAAGENGAVVGFGSLYLAGAVREILSPSR